MVRPKLAVSVESGRGHLYAGALGDNGPGSVVKTVEGTSPSLT